ncbi:hypothetical protein IC229_20620 [Spirosoma sp. BT702]|uniref:Outer membrane lipoprotein-sorting protein n=1 Tax=Spirosoma profusum TaxID=2771354 RepID=A0A927ARY9_9BACT|nr:hypothetical protein [Spirosoma profusum]MBD2703063.1 hypothetical protein [Spirosoma profusum]
MRIICLAACLLLGGTISIAQVKKTPNPPAPGFDQSGSDARAIQIADAVMEAMGGRTAWDETQLVAWTYDGVRKFVWNKYSGSVRIDNLRDDQTILLNINNDMGRVYRNGEELTQPDSVAKYVKQSKKHWLNDSHWLFMPFKLKDTGVTLCYVGDEPTQSGKPADVLLVTYKGSTNVASAQYKVWVDKKSHLVSQWAHFQDGNDKEPTFTLPWEGYEQHGTILLATERGERDLSDIMVFTGLPGEVFSDFTRTDLSRYPEAK